MYLLLAVGRILEWKQSTAKIAGFRGSVRGQASSHLLLARDRILDSFYAVHSVTAEGTEAPQRAALSTGHHFLLGRRVAHHQGWLISLELGNTKIFRTSWPCAKGKTPWPLFLSCSGWSIRDSVVRMRRTMR